MKVDYTKDTSGQNLVLFSLVALGLTHLVVFTIPGKVVGLSWVSLWLATMPILIPALAVVLAYRATRWNWYGLGLIAAVFAVTSLLQFDNTRWSSVGYSFIYLIFAALILNGLQFVNKRQFRSLAGLVLILYFANVVITQLLYHSGLRDSILYNVFRYQIDARISDIRYTSFADEPSYAGTIVAISYYVYLRLSQLLDENPSWLITGMVFYQILMFRSVYGYLLFMLVIMGFYYHRMRRSLVLIIPTAILAVIFLVNAGSLSDTGRLGKVVAGAVSGKVLDHRELLAVDASAYYRLGTALMYWESVDLTSPRFYFGNGAGTNSKFFSSLVLSEIRPDEATGKLIEVPGMFIQGFMYDFGLIGFILVVMVILRMTTTRFLSLATLFLAAISMNASFNTQLFWYTIFMLAACKHYSKESSTEQIEGRIGASPVLETIEEQQ